MNYKWFYKTPEEFDNIYLTSDGNYLTCYGGGLKNKIALLKLEGNDMTKFYLKEGKNEKTKLL